MALNHSFRLDRGAGVLMPVSALPSPYGIGSFGTACYNFIDFLKQIGCSYWQVLPLGPTGYGDSPYQSYSAFAGNPYFIDLDNLINEGLLNKNEINKQVWQVDEQYVDYDALFKFRIPVLRKAFIRSNHRSLENYRKFCEKNCYWLDDYALYMSLKISFLNKSWIKWDKDAKNRQIDLLYSYSEQAKDEIEFWKFCQYKFKEQWNHIKHYANASGIKIIGDMPLYVSEDSADVWTHSELFELDQEKRPSWVAGVPPDDFSDKGQRWGNPLYRWRSMKQDNYTWWKERMRISSELYDVIRIDHFIGIVNYYAIPASSNTAMEGKWITGPGKQLTDVMNESIGDIKIIAEDLGIISPKVRKLINKNGYPSMKVISFAIQGPSSNEYLPHNFNSKNIVAYTGTHDNETLMGLLLNKTEEELRFALQYFNVTEIEDLPNAIIRCLYSSVADVVICPMQDLLALDNRARMNYPSTTSGNWRWRIKHSMYQSIDWKLIKGYAELYSRIPNMD